MKSSTNITLSSESTNSLFLNNYVIKPIWKIKFKYSYNSNGNDVVGLESNHRNELESNMFVVKIPILAVAYFSAVAVSFIVYGYKVSIFSH